MPPAKNQPPPPAAEPLYPAIEGFIERATAEDIAALFDPLRDGLTALKGPKAEQAKKVGKAIKLGVGYETLKEPTPELAVMVRKLAAELLACHDDHHHPPSVAPVVEAELLLKRLGLPFGKEEPPK